MNIWPILLEKAWAKFNGSYEDIQSGHSKEVKSFMPFPLECDLKKFEECSKSELEDLIESKITQN